MIHWFQRTLDRVVPDIGYSALWMAGYWAVLTDEKMAGDWAVMAETMAVEWVVLMVEKMAVE